MTSDITKGYRALLCMFTTFCGGMCLSPDLGTGVYSSNHARGLTYSQIVEIRIYFVEKQVV